ncbi:hypothetical protein OsJ_05355 [Oryza sativa Japonica Group]|uniref:Uncharacterized protein n=1 Tax=Oryza sativa subsp. japonica TaxID=39947 RepID=B9F2P4_ORYSJ|nr:hypothetical protein OsJ_05355 [Oryza sativa Japonica Group]
MMQQVPLMMQKPSVNVHKIIEWSSCQAQQQVRCCRIRRHFLIDNCGELLEENLAQQSSAMAAKDASVALGDSDRNGGRRSGGARQRRQLRRGAR